MVTLLYRNYLAPQVEVHEAAITAYMDLERTEHKAKRVVLNRIYYAEVGGIEVGGIALSAFGVFLLLAEVWLVLTS